jgi:hypothetical protein
MSLSFLLSFLAGLFPNSQPYAHKKVTERGAEQAISNPDAPWDAYDHLVALAAWIQHMRAVDRHLVDLPYVAMQIFKVLWPGEAMPANLTLISDRLKDACRRIREWKCSVARAGADAALRVACSWYVDLDLDALHSLRGDAPTDTDPVVTAKWRDRAYHIAEFAPFRTFIPPPEDVKDDVSDVEEAGFGEDEEEDEEAGEGDALLKAMLRRKLLMPACSPPLSEYFSVCMCHTWLSQKQCSLNSTPVCRCV